ncbi:MAG: 2-oxo-4-hydroxy-4-carboxy-5-ureidoimidazoline decarboxylase [Janthinobacterium lividum]
MSYIQQWNSMPASEAAEAILPCCGSRAWALALASRRPLSTLPELLAASDAAWWSLPEADWQQAFDSHPRIGERHAPGTATAAALAWSGTEQGTAMAAADATKARLAEGNRAYEAKFSRNFIICANGKNADEILHTLDHRLHSTAEAELQEAAEQQRQITHIRLQRWLSEREGAPTA